MKMDSENLGQAKKRNAKVWITEVAIEKVPFIEYKGLTEKQNDNIQKIAQEVLRLSREQNESNEVAITCDLADENMMDNYGVAFGDEMSVSVNADTLSFHILMTAREATVIVLHNHPSTKTFSVNDLRYLFVYAKIKMLVVVSNQGTIHYIMKEKKYDREDALKLLKECVAENNKSNNAVTNAYKASVSFLSRCSEAGLFYR